jgi:hypothetical protein
MYSVPSCWLVERPHSFEEFPILPLKKTIAKPKKEGMHAVGLLWL